MDVITIKLKNVNPIIRNSSVFQSLYNDLDNDEEQEIEIISKYYFSCINITNLEELKKNLNCLRYWNINLLED
jgi:hypothetical protein